MLLASRNHYLCQYLATDEELIETNITSFKLYLYYTFTLSKL